MEVSVLTELFDSTRGDRWVNNDNWTTESNLDDWFGVATANSQVVCLSICDNNMNGHIPHSLWTLKDLKALSLKGNKLCGTIAEELGHLTCLDILELERNRLTGSIPMGVENLLKLKTFNMSKNLFTGSIPTSIGYLSNLMELNLENNQLRGSVPDTVGSLLSLEVLRLDRNRFVGSLPNSVGKLLRLRELSVGGNQFSGNIPASITKLTQLQVLNMAANQIKDDLSINLCHLDSGYRLKRFFSGCYLICKLPENIGELSNLVLLNLEKNRLEGSIPQDISRLINLQNLYLQGNKFNGTLPTGIGNCTSLKELNLWRNSISGPIPDSIGDCSLLVLLNLYKNNLTGSIPSTLGDLCCLEELDLGENTLSGTIPASLTNCASLCQLTLCHNELTGVVPVAILSNNTCELDVTGNKLTEITVNAKKVRRYRDYAFLYLHILGGYLDLISDMLAIVTLFEEGNVLTARINVALVGFHLFLYLLQARNFFEVILTFLQLRPLWEGLKSARDGTQTATFAVLKKIDAVSRSAPTAVLQLNSVFESLPSLAFRHSVTRVGSLTVSSLTILLVSVFFSILGTSMSLASNAHYSGHSIISVRFWLLLLMFISECVFRVVTVALLFTVLGWSAFAIIGSEFVLRLILEMVAREACSWEGQVFEKAIIRLGTDVGSEKEWVRNGFGFFLTTLEGYSALLILFKARTTTFVYLNASKLTAVIAVTVCGSWMLKAFLWGVVLWVLPALPARSISVSPGFDDDSDHDADSSIMSGSFNGDLYTGDREEIFGRGYSSLTHSGPFLGGGTIDVASTYTDDCEKDGLVDSDGDCDSGEDMYRREGGVWVRNDLITPLVSSSAVQPQHRQQRHQHRHHQQQHQQQQKQQQQQQQLQSPLQTRPLGLSNYRAGLSHQISRDLNDDSNSSHHQHTRLTADRSHSHHNISSISNINSSNSINSISSSNSIARPLTNDHEIIGFDSARSSVSSGSSSSPSCSMELETDGLLSLYETHGADSQPVHRVGTQDRASDA